MSSSALESQGMTIQVGDAASPEVFTTIPEVTEIGGPGGQANEIDVSDLSSTGKEFRIGLKDEGQITLSMAWRPANAVHDGLWNDRTARTLRNFKLNFTDSPVSDWTFAAYVMGIEISNSVDDVTRASVTLRVSGAVTSSV